MSGDEHGSGSGPESLPSASDFAALASALNAQARAIHNLASSLSQMAVAIADLVDDGEPDAPIRTYLDGSSL